ncbi:hypothetical protein EYC98_14320 [Halieaceae bacterium IMCC14734]|uniref:SnoaL-like domain-containing protein n=1 Tax=Candidatus Litorirhabdus singularis TaxID=2518993 RepID=A0ABT3TIJ6_9GAMM|nr:nuclear transport factor 2 family protein [Candidatus Litorirhabdus singularis]MCX2982035.1 hypothetical protein [Candidatus Litorirhabdus singularis]
MKKQATLIFVLLMLLASRGYSMECNKGLLETQAIQQIEYLRRWYANATDLIGVATPQSIAEGRAIYRRIFAKEAQLYAGSDDEPRVGPEAWAELVLEALGDLGPTQHLIGTQLVKIKSLKFDDDCNIVTGSAYMESYVQAWHELKDDRVWLFLGTYEDDVGYTSGGGWQIERMHLRQVSAERRYRDTAVGRAAD